MFCPIPSRASGRQRLNARLAWQALRRGAGAVIHRPVDVYLQVASGCNLDCYMCSEHNLPLDARRGRRLHSLTPEVFARVEREILPWSLRLYLGVGGESTISDHFSDYVRRSAAAGQEIHLTTNGTRLEREDVARVIADHVAHVHLSLDAATPGTYERIRNGARWERIRRGIEVLNSNRAASDPRGRCHLTLSFVLMRSNVQELPAFVELAREVGADAVSAQHVIPVTDEGREETLMVDAGRYNALRAEAVERARSLGMPLELPDSYPVGEGKGADRLPSCVAAPSAAPYAPEVRLPESVDSSMQGYSVPCCQPNQATYVFYDGRVFPCCHPFAHQKMELGNLSVQRFREVWNHRLYRNLRAGLSSGEVPAICRICSLAHPSPSSREDAADLANHPDLAEFYGARDLDPVRAGADWTAPSGWPESEGLTRCIVDLRQHGEDLEAERAHLDAHIANLEAELAHLRRHAATLQEERSHSSAHIATLEAERPHLLGHIRELERTGAEVREDAATREEERKHLCGHIENLEAERPHLRGHIDTLEREREALTRHVGGLEEERRQLRLHVGNLEQEREAVIRHAGNLEESRRDLDAHMDDLELQRRAMVVCAAAARRWHALVRASRRLLGRRATRGLGRLAGALGRRIIGKDEV